ncbi:MAG TPA: cytochrome c [Polyangiales bacterium]|nr:cytochrome c [Polyangiales bacterium]
MIRSRHRCSLFVLAAFALLGCQEAWSKVDLERMIDQPRGKAFKASEYFPDGRLMQPPPANTVPMNRVLGPEPLVEGTERGQFVSTIPMSLDRAVLQRGRGRFEVFCAACHAIDGSGDSQVAQHMELRRPPSLVTEPVRAYPVGRVFRAVTHGYGLMPGYQRDLSVSDRWAVVGYVRALQRSRGTALASLPEPVRASALKELR